MEEKKNSYIDYLDNDAQKYDHTIREDWKELEEYFDYVLNDCSEVRDRNL